MLLHFAGDMTEEELIRKAAEKGVRVYGLSQYYIDPPDGLKPTIMLGYVHLNKAASDTADTEEEPSQETQATDTESEE